ncbi:hypothetical protein DOTSEDRAFT_129332 [Dothistroma septosporum NZE10]|uniref:YjgF-like protein n=1 Tax=Dothistroma septosporum (strain NZE10 / CBS 128990) TaxID=675120 RepID=N1PNY8_DOTSN|nr:hypothetical protein DOTSEDRAFT_129332 [Dothistroma septosporum NZE10]
MASSRGFDDKPRAFNPEGVPKPPPTYNQACITPILHASKFITLAGQTGITPETGKVASTSIAEQAKQAYKTVHTALRAAGAYPRDIIHVRHYIVTETGDPEVDKVDVVERGWGGHWMEFMDREAHGHRPPDTVLGVASLAKRELLYEVEVWAIVHG